jgi:cytochrome oxidase Cu insertion factor (SCO1/SenC/PrrC family)
VRIRGGGQAGPRAAPGTAGHGKRALLVAGLAVALLAAAGAAGVVASQRPGQPSLPRPSGLPANISTSLANLMQLSALGGTPAPGFTLTDQHGQRLSLASLRGKVVVLEFMDPHCVDICPIVSQEFVDAYHDLGSAARKVVFAAVNVNPYHRSVAAVAAFSAEHLLTEIPDWHFLTGPLPVLRAVWRDYHIVVEAPSPNADIIHTSAVYFLSPRGAERYVASPMADHTAKGTAYLPAGQLAAWGSGIARVARDLAG